MGDRHGGRFARRGRALSPPRRDFPMPRCGVPMARCGGRDLPRARTLPSAKASRHGARAKGFTRAGTRSSAKASRHGARAKGFAPREKALLGESLPTRRTGERICPAQERSPRRKHPDTAHERKNLPRAGTRPSAKAHEQKDLCPRENTPLGEGLPTRHTGERICPAGVRPRPTCRRTAGRPRPTDSRKTPLRRGRTREGAAAAEFIHRKK